MKKTIVCFILAVLIWQTSGLPQGFEWGNIDFTDDNVVLSSSTTRPTRPRPQPQNSSPAFAAGTTTTTQSPQFVQCTRNCPATPEYNPVCGTDRQTYPNENRLRCAQRCGANVQRAFGGTCSPLR